MNTAGGTGNAAVASLGLKTLGNKVSEIHTTQASVLHSKPSHSRKKSEALKKSNSSQ